MYILKLLITLIIPLFIYANSLNAISYDKELKILNSFNIDASFLNDSKLKKMRIKNRSSGRDRYFFRAIKEASIFLPSIKNILAQKRVPQEFLFLAMAESNFLSTAYSPKKAAGLWQFMPYTASLYNLKIDRYVDERNDLIKSTKAAALHLQNLHDTFGKWYLAIIAYNCGDGRLINAIKKAKSEKLEVLLDEKKKYIPRETRNYIRRVVSYAFLGSDEKLVHASKQKHLLKMAHFQSITAIKLPAGETLSRVAKIINMPFKSLKKLNRHLKYNFTPPYVDSYEVYIPNDKLAIFKKNYFKKAIQKIYQVHIVIEGDNLSQIGKKYGIPYRVIMDFNKLKNTNLKLRQKLIIPIDKYKKV